MSVRHPNPRPTTRRARTVTGVAAAALVTAAMATPGAAAADRSRVIDVVMSDAGFSLPATLPAGWVTFRARTADPIGHQLEAFRPRGGASVPTVVDDIDRAASTDLAVSAAGTRDADRDAEFVGGPAVDPVTEVSVTVFLDRGTYQFFDFDDPFTPGQQIRLHEVRVEGPARGDAPRATDRIGMEMTTDGPRFTVSGSVQADKTVRIDNRSNEIHELLMSRVRPGTTDADVSAYYASGSTAPAPYAAESGIRGLAAISPGRVAYLRYERLPHGAYVLLCYAADEESGVPHLYEGMHAVARFHG